MVLIIPQLDEGAISEEIMKYHSTRGGVQGVSFKDALLSGYASDGGLLVPDSLPYFSLGEWRAFAKLSYPEIVEELLCRFISPEEITRRDLHGRESTLDCFCTCGGSL